MPQAAPFLPRFGHCALVFGDKIWILGGYSAAGAPINDVPEHVRLFRPIAGTEG